MAGRKKRTNRLSSELLTRLKKKEFIRGNGSVAIERRKNTPALVK